MSHSKLVEWILLFLRKSKLFFHPYFQTSSVDLNCCSHAKCCLESDVGEGTEGHQRCYSTALPISSICSNASVYCHRRFDCYEPNPATSGWRPTRNNCVSGFAELDGLYISCQPQTSSCFFSPLSPDHVALAGQPAVRLYHAEIPVSHQRPNFSRLFPGRAHGHRLNSWPNGRVYCSLKQFIAIGCTAILLFPLHNINNNKLQAKSHGQADTSMCVCVFWQIKRVIHYILTVEMFWGCLFSTKNHLEGNFWCLILWVLSRAAASVLMANIGDLCCTFSRMKSVLTGCQMLPPYFANMDTSTLASFSWIKTHLFCYVLGVFDLFFIH